MFNQALMINSFGNSNLIKRNSAGKSTRLYRLHYTDKRMETVSIDNLMTNKSQEEQYVVPNLDS